MSNPTARRSRYDLASAWNYLRLSFQSMSTDQDEARAMVQACAQYSVLEERLLHLNGAILARIMTLIQEKEKVQ
jgi:hypothetical protein